MADQETPIVATNSPSKSPAASKHQEITIKEKIKADSIASQYYSVTKAD
jgi:hypothetical protein